MAKTTFEYTEGKLFINGLEKNPSIVSKARYAKGLKKEKQPTRRLVPRSIGCRLLQR